MVRNDTGHPAIAVVAEELLELGFIEITEVGQRGRVLVDADSRIRADLSPLTGRALLSYMDEAGPVWRVTVSAATPIAVVLLIVYAVVNASDPQAAVAIAATVLAALPQP